MRRILLYLFVGAVSAVAVACQDSLSPAGKSASPSIANASFSRSNPGPQNERSLITTLTISPEGGTYHVGDFDVVIPAGAVCDPQRTAYGVRHWDDDCVPADRDITVSVVARTHKGQVSVDFKPDLRFRPAAGWVTIRTAAYSDLLTSDAVRQLSPSSAYFAGFSILYVPTGGQAHIDEVRSTGDPSLVTHVDRSTGLVWRRIKHFSGYMITSGNKCDASVPDATTCIVDDGSGGTGIVGSGSLGTTFGSSTLSLTVSDLQASVVVTP